MKQSLNESLSDVCVGDYVEIHDTDTGTSQGTVCEIMSQLDTPKVRLINGDRGHVIRIIDSESISSKRIMNEDQYSENKENFSEAVMRNKVIPQTVQSFLNSEGGYLYIGVKDTGELKDRLVGLDYDFKSIDSPDRSNDKLCDVLKTKIMDTLDKYLSSNTSLGPLVDVRFVYVLNVQIIEIRIQKSPEPWFYRNISKNGKPRQFMLCADGESNKQRILDDFYIRQGDKKKLLETHEKFYMYFKEHFQNLERNVM